MPGQVSRPWVKATQGDQIKYTEAAEVDRVSDMPGWGPPEGFEMFSGWVGFYWWACMHGRSACGVCLMCGELESIQSRVKSRVRNPVCTTTLRCASAAIHIYSSTTHCGPLSSTALTLYSRSALLICDGHTYAAERCCPLPSPPRSLLPAPSSPLAADPASILQSHQASCHTLPYPLFPSPRSCTLPPPPPCTSSRYVTVDEAAGRKLFYVFVTSSGCAPVSQPLSQLCAGARGCWA